jgi:hypothetical protein
LKEDPPPLSYNVSFILTFPRGRDLLLRRLVTATAYCHESTLSSETDNQIQSSRNQQVAVRRLEQIMGIDVLSSSLFYIYIYIYKSIVLNGLVWWCHGWITMDTDKC